MNNQTDNDVITIPKTALKGQKGAVILDLGEYKRLLKYEIEQEHNDMIVQEGLQEEKEGKTESMDGFLKREYPKLYEDYKD